MTNVIVAVLKSWENVFHAPVAVAVVVVVVVSGIVVALLLFQWGVLLLLLVVSVVVCRLWADEKLFCRSPQFVALH